MTEYVLVAEDDPKQAELIRLYLQRDGFEVEVVADGRQALARAAARRPDVAVLDVMMPEVDGLAVCRELAADHGVPVVLLTARSTENDLLLGLYLGADDYVTKPYSPRELVARVRTVLRRSRRTEAATPVEIVVGDLVISARRHQVRLAGAVVELTPAEFDLLLIMARRRDQVVTRRELLAALHGGADYLTERTIDSHVMNMRRKLEERPGAPTRLVTVYGVGYKLLG